MDNIITHILPNGKIIYNNSNLYQSNLKRLLTQDDYNHFDDDIKNINNNISQIQSSFDNAIVFGTYSFATGNRVFNVSLGFKPKIVFIYSEKGNDVFPTFRGGSVEIGELYTILTQAYYSDYESSNHITNNGFSFYVLGSVKISTIYYAAMKFT